MYLHVRRPHSLCRTQKGKSPLPHHTSPCPCPCGIYGTIYSSTCCGMQPLRCLPPSFFLAVLSPSFSLPPLSLSLFSIYFFLSFSPSLSLFRAHSCPFLLCCTRVISLALPSLFLSRSALSLFLSHTHTCSNVVSLSVWLRPCTAVQFIDRASDAQCVGPSCGWARWSRDAGSLHCQRHVRRLAHCHGPRPGETRQRSKTGYIIFISNTAKLSRAYFLKYRLHRLYI